jgi:lysozyme
MSPDPRPTPTETFEQWFARQKFKHFKAQEITWMWGRVNKGVRNSEPPRNLWRNIVPTLRILDDLRAHFTAPITLNSTYRSLAYNRSVGSPDGSQHRRFSAIDFRVAGHSPAAVARVLKGWRAGGKFTAGIGTYKTFVHLDTRKNNATW